MKSFKLLLSFCLFLSNLNPIFVEAKPLTPMIAQSDRRTRRIQFNQGEISTTVEDAVIRGTRDIYLLGANASQVMTVSLTSVENNAVFDLVSPNNIILRKEVTNTHLVLPEKGDYRIIVSGTRGNATYNLYVEIYPKMSDFHRRDENPTNILTTKHRLNIKTILTLDIFF